MPDDLFNLRNEMAVAENLKRQLADIQKNDPEFMTAIIESETDVFELIEKLDKQLAEEEMLIKAMALRIDELSSRKARMDDAAKTKRDLIGSALDQAGIQKHRTTESTISVVPIPRKAIIQQESDIPARFWAAQKPRLDKKALTEALRNGETVPGATLDNGGKTVRVLRK